MADHAIDPRVMMLCLTLSELNRPYAVLFPRNEDDLRMPMGVTSWPHVLKLTTAANDPDCPKPSKA